MFSSDNSVNWNAYIIAFLAGLIYLILVVPPVQNYMRAQMKNHLVYYLITALILITLVFLLVNWLE